jgi:hypothetical protein
MTKLVLIFNNFDFMSKIKFRSISKYIHHFIVIDDLYNIPEKYLYLLSDKIFKFNKIRYIM